MRNSRELSVLKVRLPSGDRRQRTERAASLVEYALLVSLIAIVCFVAVMYFGNETSKTFSRAGDSVSAL